MTPTENLTFPAKKKNWSAKLLNLLFQSYRMNSEEYWDSMPDQSFPLDSFQTFGDLLKYLRRRRASRNSNSPLPSVTVKRKLAALKKINGVQISLHSRLYSFLH